MCPSRDLDAHARQHGQTSSPASVSLHPLDGPYGRQSILIPSAASSDPPLTFESDASRKARLAQACQLRAQEPGDVGDPLWSNMRTLSRAANDGTLRLQSRSAGLASRLTPTAREDVSDNRPCIAHLRLAPTETEPNTKPVHRALNDGMAADRAMAATPPSKGKSWLSWRFWKRSG